MAWVVDFFAGVVLATLLYWLVRFRMLVAPIMRDRFGSWARWLTWFVVILLMVIVANLELVWLREFLHERFGLISALPHEIFFSLIAFSGGYFLVTRYMNRSSRSAESGNCLGKKES